MAVTQVEERGIYRYGRMYGRLVGRARGMQKGQVGTPGSFVYWVDTIGCYTIIILLVQ